MKFTDETKEVKEFNSNYFGYGVHKVAIGLFELNQTEAGKEYIEVTVMDPEDGEKTDTSRVWFTSEKAANYAFNTLRAIAVHSGTSEKMKTAIGDAMDAVPGTDELVVLLNEKLIGKECWFTKYVDPERTYEAKDGTVRQSVNKNVYGYEPKLNEALMPKDQQQIKASDFPADDEGNVDVASKVDIPDEWS